jgi:uncharacterized protein GlcG (DUF336 family)
MRSYVCVATAAALVASAAAAESAEFYKVKILPTDLAIEAAETAVASCPRGIVSVVDANGTERAFIASDNSQTRVITTSSRAKALTALWGGMPSLDLVKPAMAEPGGITAFVQNNKGLAPGDGGVPIRVRGELIGAIGMSAPGAVAHVCAEKGIAKIQDRLNALQ